MKIFLYLFIWLLIPTLCFAQNRNSVWIFGDSAGIDFSNINNPVPITSGMDGRGSCVSVSDNSGDLQFYSWNLASYDDSATFLTNALHDTMENGSRLTGGDEYNQIVITPLHSISNYYAFHLGILTTYGLYYSLVDMSQNGGLGEVIQKNVQINNLRPGDCLTTVKHGNGRDWWVISKLSDFSGTQHNRFFVYLVTSDSIYAPFIQDFNDATDADIQKVIWQPLGIKFMLINIGGYMLEFNFDRCTGLITLNRNIYPELSSNFHRFFWDGAYSSSGNTFYVSTTPYFSSFPNGYLVQYDLTVSNIDSSADTLAVYQSPIGPGAVRLAPDNKIYFSRAYECNAFPSCYPYPDSVRNYVNENLSVINSPDSLGAACNYQPFSFYLGGKRTYYGLPNNSNYDLGPLAGSVCDSLTIGIEETTKSNAFGKLYPNPFRDKIRLAADGSKRYKIVISDLTGRVVYQILQHEKPEIDLSFLNEGLYLVTLSDNKSIYQTKILKQ